MGYKRVIVYKKHLKQCVALLFLITLVSCSRETITGTPDSNTPPAVPSNVDIFSAHDGAVGIEWTGNSESGILGYNIYRSISNGNMKKIGLTSETHYIDYPLSYDTVYYYSVTALNSFGMESGQSLVVSANPININPPTAIYDISINGRNSITTKYIHLSWIPQQDYDVKNYEIYRSDFFNFSVEPRYLIGSSTFPSFDDYNITTLHPYYYKVISVDNGGLKSSDSPVVSDLVLESPILISPGDNATVKNLTSFQFKSSYAASMYKIIIQSNELYGTVAEFNVYSGKLNETISFQFDSTILTSYKKYYWRVIAYSSSSGEPNSFSPLYSFTFIAE